MSQHLTRSHRAGRAEVHIRERCDIPHREFLAGMGEVDPKRNRGTPPDATHQFPEASDILSPTSSMWSPQVRRRKFIVLIGGAVASPFLATAQDRARVLQIGFLYPGPHSTAPLRIKAALTRPH